MTTWKNKLTMEEREHLKTINATTLSALKRTLEDHAKWRIEHPNSNEPCWTCREIGRKLEQELRIS